MGPIGGGPGGGADAVVAAAAVLCDNRAMPALCPLPQSPSPPSRGFPAQPVRRSIVAGAIVPLLAAMLVLNAHALRREADKLPLDSPLRAPALRALSPLCRATSATGLDRPRAWAEALEVRLLNE